MPEVAAAPSIKLKVIVLPGGSSAAKAAVSSLSTLLLSFVLSVMFTLIDAAGMLPAALGTQLKGSIIRPAGYCANYAIKPSYGAINRGGGHSTSPSGSAWIYLPVVGS